MIKPYFQDGFRTVYNKSCTDMSELPDNSVQCVVTSPPYWGLRKYAGAQDLIWDNHNGCVHEWGEEIVISKGNLGNNLDTLAGTQTAGVAKEANHLGQYCQSCNAWRGAFGLEPTVEMYVEHTVEILREVRRVLRQDGVCFWNVGDSYAGGGNNRGNGKPLFDKQASNRGTASCMDTPQRQPQESIKAKDLCLIPFRVALAAQADGWWVRSIIIWNKLNPMPESVKDRPTESHEYIIMLTKSSRYYWDMEAVREKQTESSIERSKYGWHGRTDDGSNGSRTGSTFKAMAESDGLIATIPEDGNRNLRSVWTFATQPFSGAHFATYPEELPERCIKAASKEGDTVLDPFCGSGTTLKVAAKLGRKSIGYDISTEYMDLIIDRNRQGVML